MPEHTFYSIIPQKVRVVNRIIVKLVEIREILMLGVGVWTTKGTKGEDERDRKGEDEMGRG